MADDTHAPSWGEIATGFGEYAEWLCNDERGDAGYGHDYRDGSGYQAAHRWLAQHDREVRAEALRGAADAWTQGEWSNYIPPRGTERPALILGMAQAPGDWLRDRADSIEKGGGA